jgi:hypothetical protein
MKQFITNFLHRCSIDQILHWCRLDTNHRTVYGRFLHISDHALYSAQGHHILQSLDNGNSWQIWVSLPVTVCQKIFMHFPLLARLLRQGIHHLAITDNEAIVIANKMTYVINKGVVKQIGPLHGSRPMVLCQTSNHDVYYGEYHRNMDKSPMSIWKFNRDKCIWEAVWRFKAIRHIHGVFHDPYTDSIWVTTGDTDSEAGIWKTTNNFQTLQKIAGDSQQYRVIQLLFTPTYLYFGSDAPSEQNYIYRMDRMGRNLEKLVDVGSSVFFGCKVGESLFFSTAVEPSDVNLTSNSEVWQSDNGQDWHKLLEFKKDIWSMKYFQHGQVLFPTGNNNSQYLYLSLFATEQNGKLLVINLHNNQNKY